MKCCWLKLLLLATFAFWASGAAKFAHEALEHHGLDASVDDDDDGGSPTATLSSGQAPLSPQPASPVPPKKPCPICQMLAAMVVDRSAPPVIPTLSTLLIETLVLSDRVAPNIHACFVLSARGPPAAAFAD